MGILRTEADETRLGKPLPTYSSPIHYWSLRYLVDGSFLYHAGVGQGCNQEKLPIH